MSLLSVWGKPALDRSLDTTLGVAGAVVADIAVLDGMPRGTQLTEEPAGAAAPREAKLPGGAWQPLGEMGVGGRSDAVSVNPGNPNHVLVSGDMLGVARSLDGGHNWEGDASGLLSYEMSAFTWHPTNPNVVWVGSLSGPAVSRDGGLTWTPKRRGMPEPSFGRNTAPVEVILFDPNDPGHDRLLTFGGDYRHFKSPTEVDNPNAVWISEDGGENWALETTLGDGNYVMSATYGGDNGQTIWATVTGSGVFRSTGDGAAGTWVTANNGLPPALDVGTIKAHPTDENVAWVTEREGGVFMTTDGGANWVAKNKGLKFGIYQPSGYKALELAEILPDGKAVLYTASVSGWPSRDIYKSVDGGDNWVTVLPDDPPALQTTALLDGTPMPAGLEAAWIAASPSDPDTVFAVTSEHLLKTTDGGATWDDVSSRPSPDDPTKWVGGGYTGWVSNNGAWNPFNHHQIVLQAFDAGKLIVSRDGGRSWALATHGMSSPWGGGNDVEFFDADRWFASVGQHGYSGEVVRSYDAGLNWQPITHPAGNGHQVDSLHVDRGNPGRLWALSWGQLYYSENADEGVPGAVTWTPVTVGAETRVFSIARDPASDVAFYVSTPGGIYYSPGDNSFTPLGGPTNHEGGRMAMAVDARVPGRIWVANFHDRDWNNTEGGLWRYDSGKWKRVFRGSSWITDVAVDPTDSNRLAFVTGKAPYGDFTNATGVCLTENGGVSWKSCNDGLPMLRGDTIEFSPDGTRLVVGTSGRGFFQMDLRRGSDAGRIAGSVVGVKDYLHTVHDD